MGLIDKDKLLEELIEGQKAGLGLIKSSEYDNINSVDDAIEAVKYADEVDLSEHDNKIRANEQEKILNKAYTMLGDELIWVLHTFGDDVYMSVADSISSTFCQLLKEQNPDYEKEQNLSQLLPTIDEEECDNEEEEDEDGFDPGDDN